MEDFAQDADSLLRRLPQVQRLLETPAADALCGEFGRSAVTDALRGVLDGVRARIRSGAGAFMVVDVPRATETVVYGINRAGQVIGYYRDADDTSHGFVRAPGGAITRFDVPRAAGTAGYGLNAAGQIVGTFDDANDATHGFVGRR